MYKFTGSFTGRHFLFICLLVVLTGCASTPSEYKEPPPLSVEARSALNQKVFRNAVDLIDENYFDPTFHGADWQALQLKYLPVATAAPDAEVLYAALNTMMRELGVSHLVAGTPRQAHQLETRRTAATGFSIQSVENALVVTDVIPGGPAATAGVQTGWILTARNGVPIPVPGDRFINLLGQPVTFDFLDADDQAHTLTLAPALLNFSREDSRSLPGGLLYLRFDEFSLHSLSWLSQRLKANLSAPGVVLDLRFNGGGNLAAMMSALAEFLPGMFSGGMIEAGFSVTREGKQREARAMPLFSAHYAGKLVILTDQRSASAAEILPYVLQYHKRAIIVGRSTAGAVLVSRFFDLPDGGRMQIPVSDYLGPDGQRLEGKGVTPDQVLPAATLVQRRRGEDPDLQAALAVLLKQ